MEIEIRPMQKSDVDNVIRIEEKAYGEHHWSKDSFLNELSNELARYYAACSPDGSLVGYAGCWQILEEVHITNIAVSPELRRKKIGERLLQKRIDDCYKNKAKYITLEVRISNEAAISLYEKYGFQSLGTRKGYYQDNNEDALIMWTENIFYDKFKTKYMENKEKLKKSIEIK